MIDNAIRDLRELDTRLNSFKDTSINASFSEPIETIEQAAKEIGKSWCGSWIGYHANVYYEGFTVPPQGARFSQEWGLMDATFIRETIGDWIEYRPDNVVEYIYSIAQHPNLTLTDNVCKELKKLVNDSREEMLSIFITISRTINDVFLSRLNDEVGKVKVPTKFHILEAIRPSGQIISRDMRAITQGLCTPPHIDVLAEMMAKKQPVDSLTRLSDIARRAVLHLQKQGQSSTKKSNIITKIFIGHGRSPLWRELKDFIQERLALQYDEFNRVPVAGFTNTERLTEMLDDASIAFLILTGEDEQVDGKLYARLNVIHEAGLFQGRIGFKKAIVLLEEGCEEFSNIHGLGQIRFPKGNISSILEEVRRVLEREGVIKNIFK